MKISLLFLLTAFSLSVAAQSSNKPPKGQLMSRGIGISFQSFDGLNSRIANLPQYKTLRDYMGIISLGSMNVHKNFVSGLNVTVGSSLSGDRDKKSSALRTLGGEINLGYDVIPGDKFMLYPMVGIGAEGYQARFYKDNSGVNFNDVLTSGNVQNNIRPVGFKNSFFTYNLGLGFNVKANKQGSSVGIKAGYTGSFKDRSWKSSDNQVLGNAPVDGLSRFNVSLVINSIPRFMH